MAALVRQIPSNLAVGLPPTGNKIEDLTDTQKIVESYSRLTNSSLFKAGRNGEVCWVCLNVSGGQILNTGLQGWPGV